MPYKTPEEAKAYRRAYYLKNREKLIQATKDWTASQTPEQIEATRKRKLEWGKENYTKVSNERKRYGLDYYYANREKVLKQKLERRLANPDLERERQAARRAANPEAEKARQRAWKEKNADHVEERRIAYLARRRELSKLRRAENPTRKLAENFRSRICGVLKRAGTTKTDTSFSFLGCTANFFKDFLEHQFTPEMNWSNYGTYWVVDHVIPIASFQIQNPDHLRNAFHYSNCRPLVDEDNSAKNDSMPGPHQPSLL